MIGKKQDYKLYIATENGKKKHKKIGKHNKSYKGGKENTNGLKHLRTENTVKSPKSASATNLPGILNTQQTNKKGKKFKCK